MKLLFVIAFMSAFVFPFHSGQAKTLFDINQWRNSSSSSDDLDGDGIPEIFRTFHANGRLASVRVDQQEAIYDPSGKLERWQKSNSKGMVLERFLYPKKGADYRWMHEYDRNGDGHFEEVVIAKNVGGDIIVTSSFDANKDGKAERRDQYTLSALASMAGDCPMPQTNVDAAIENLQTVIGRIDTFIDVRDTCQNGLRFENPNGDAATTMTRDQLKTEMASAASEGLTCLAGMGNNSIGRQLAARLITTTFANDQQVLKLDCNPQDTIACWRRHGQNWCGSSSRSGDSLHPHIALGGECQRTATGFKRLILHELTHTCGELHHYDNASGRETVEACAQCCFYEAPTRTPASVRETMCKLCRNEYPNPIQHNLAFAWGRLSQGETSVQVINELHKVVILDPNNAEAWYLLMRVLGDKVRNSEASDMEKLLAYRALTRFRELKADPTQVNRANLLHPSQWPNGTFCQTDNRFINMEYCQLSMELIEDSVVENVDTPRVLSSFDSDLVAGVNGRQGLRQVMVLQQELRTIQAFCGPFSNQTSTTPAPSTAELEARHCYRRYQQTLEDMERAVQDVTAMNNGGLASYRREVCNTWLIKNKIQVTERTIKSCLSSKYRGYRRLMEETEAASLQSMAEGRRRWLEDESHNRTTAAQADSERRSDCPSPHNPTSTP